MQAIILAAGLGTRLRPITDEVPKCMVSVNGIRIIDKQIDNLHKAGVKDIVVVGGYKADVLKSTWSDIMELHLLRTPVMRRPTICILCIWL